jgi:uncharacterized protein YndB with AHSA1/START domain
MRLTSLHSYHFASPPEAVWAAMGDVDRYRDWWPWLRRFDAEALAAGDRWHCLVKPPLPYELAFTLTLRTVRAAEAIEVDVSGDVRGTAGLTLTPSGEGAEVRVRSELTPVSRLLTGVALVAWPVARFAHDWVIDTGARQFAHRAL